MLSLPVHDPVEELYETVTASACETQALLVIPESVMTTWLSVPVTRDTDDTAGEPGHTLAVHENVTPVVERFWTGTAADRPSTTVILFAAIDATVGALGGLNAPTTPFVGISFANAMLTGARAVSRKSGDAGSELEPPLTNAGALMLITLPDCV